MPRFRENAVRFPDLPGDPPERLSLDAEGVDLPDFAYRGTPLAQDVLERWLAAVASGRTRVLRYLQYVFVDDESLLAINREHLAHDTYTDIVTFDLSDQHGDGADRAVEGECYISVDRVRENAASFSESPDRELLRVMVHGLLHLCGLGDKSAQEAQAMRAAEELALAQLGELIAAA